MEPETPVQWSHFCGGTVATRCTADFWRSFECPVALARELVRVAAHKLGSDLDFKLSLFFAVTLCFVECRRVRFALGAYEMVSPLIPVALKYKQNKQCCLSVGNYE